MRVLRKNYSPVAQQVECRSVKAVVVGSNPTRGALEFVSYAPSPKTDIKKVCSACAGLAKVQGWYSAMRTKAHNTLLFTWYRLMVRLPPQKRVNTGSIPVAKFAIVVKRYHDCLISGYYGFESHRLYFMQV